MKYRFVSSGYRWVPILLGTIVLAAACQGEVISLDSGVADATVHECTEDRDCDDDNPCTVYVCLEGTCTHVPDDGALCDDGNMCTDDGCEPAIGCVHTNNSAPCDDGSACTREDVCDRGICTGSRVDCDDRNVCTDDGCDPVLGCVHPNNTALCDDGNACTEGDVCAGGVCAGSEMDCDDGSACTGDACDTASGGCVYTDLCDPHAGCVAGVCECDPGFEGNGYACSDVDECALGTHGCDPNATCTNTEGHYECACNYGFAGDGFTCEPTTLECGDGVCMTGEDFVSCPEDCDFDLVVVIEQGLAAELEASLDVYQEDLRQEGHRARVVNWTGGTVVELKTLLFDQVDQYDVEGGLLVGDLPAAWYEQTVFDEYEQFPVDIYLQDRDAIWHDADNDGLFDSHTSLQLEIFTARLSGTGTELADYFAKVHAYRTGGSLVDASAFIFMDDGWASWAFMSPFGLGGIYTTVDLVSDASLTTRAVYVDKLTSAGAEFVYQWIHASPTTLYIEGTGSGTIDTADIVSYNFRGSFYNLFNCFASRFTEECLAMTYVLRTDYGLATIGSTKVGGISIPGIFHNSLASGCTWGEAFRRWYNGIGIYEDGWYLGIMIIGDPLLTISGDTRGLLRIMPDRQWTSEELRALRRTMVRWAREVRLGTYEEYREANPQFFVD